VTELLEPTEMAAGWAALESEPTYKYVRPLVEHRQRFVRETQSTRNVELGIAPFDREMRGIGPGHLAMIVGYSHSGKTQLTLNVLHHNRHKRIALFTPDEPGSLVFTKLASLVWDVPAAVLEARVKLGDRDALRMLDETVEEFPHLLIFDRPLTPKLMRRSYEEAQDYWGEDGDLVIVDYLDLVQAGEGVGAKADAVKTFGTDVEVPVMLLHQTSRSAGTNGRPMRIDSGNYGGETWATFQLGVWRKRDAIANELVGLREKRTPSEWDMDRIVFLERELAIHQYTLTVNLTKNKRPGGGRIEDGIDFELHDTGHLRMLDGDLPTQYLRDYSLRSVR
jgi:replicative DNA helicase